MVWFYRVHVTAYTGAYSLSMCVYTTISIKLIHKTGIFRDLEPISWKSGRKTAPKQFSFSESHSLSLSHSRIIKMHQSCCHLIVYSLLAEEQKCFALFDLRFKNCSISIVQSWHLRHLFFVFSSCVVSCGTRSWVIVVNRKHAWPPPKQVIKFVQSLFKDGHSAIQKKLVNLITIPLPMIRSLYWKNKWKEWKN